MSYCRDCVFCGEVAERQQQSCGMCDDPVEAIRACVEADVSASCSKRMTRGDVRRKVAELEQLKRQRDSQRDLLDVVQRVIAAALKEGPADAT